MNNIAEAIYQAITIAGVKPGAGPNGEDLLTEQSGHTFVPKTPEAFTYDDDGNLLSDGRWTYTWDAENRLVAMAASMWEPASGRRLKLLFTNDSQSRRCSKQVFPWDEQAGDWAVTPTLDLRFLYDDWNLLAEVDSAGNLVRSYTWGLDLSGSPQGAGGIGGLLFETVHTGANAGSYLPCFDGNGNLMNLASVTDGSVAATYEYSPFGETITAVGPVAAENVFRFSTKYTDAESSLVYYGYRYYSPSLGRWLSRDPIGEGDGPNLAVTIWNDEENEIDANGLYRQPLPRLPIPRGVPPFPFSPLRPPSPPPPPPVSPAVPWAPMSLPPLEPAGKCCRVQAFQVAGVAKLGGYDPKLKVFHVHASIQFRLMLAQGSTNKDCGIRQWHAGVIVQQLRSQQCVSEQTPMWTPDIGATSPSPFIWDTASWSRSANAYLTSTGLEYSKWFSPDFAYFGDSPGLENIGESIVYGSYEGSFVTDIVDWGTMVSVARLGWRVEFAFVKNGRDLQTKHFVIQ